MATPYIVGGSGDYLEIPMDESRWSIRITPSDMSGRVRVSMHWNRKDVPTHESIVEADTLYTMLEKLHG